MHPSEFNALRVSVVAERLSAYFKSEVASSNSQIPNSMEYFNLLLSLSRGIDYSIANNEIPPKAEELPKVLNEIRLRKADASAQGIVMVLMISVKNACRAGWFHEKDSQELIAYTDELGRCFCDPRNISAVSNESHSAISTILSRFYPQMKMGHVLAALEVQSGYGAFAVDFVISKSTTHLPEEKIMLFTALMDSLETSACIITPQQVNFLLNGKPVERRTNVFLDPGPLMPNNVTPLLKYGTNLLQAVGQFNGRYVIYVAFMSVSPQPEPTLLKDYVQPVASTLDSDSDLIECQSRISLNCPISRTRIQVPVKGHSCKHPQCFDYSNFLDINSRRPSWRCSHCNNYVCFTDLRIDQTIAEVLKEVGDNVSDVLISADGSWKAIIDCDNDDHDPVEPQVLDNRASVGSPHPIFDLTEDDDAMDILLSTENDEINPMQQLPTPDTQMNNGNLDEEFWSGVMEYVAGNSTSAVFKDTSNQDCLVNADSGSVQKEGRNTVLGLPASSPSPGSVQRLRSVERFPVLNSSSATTVPSTEVRVDSEKQRSDSPVNADSGSVQKEVRNSVHARHTNFPIPGSVQRSRFVNAVLSGSSAAAVPSVPPWAQRTPLVQNPSSPKLPVQNPNSPKLPVQNPNSPKPPSGQFTGFRNPLFQQAFNTRTAPLARPAGPPSETCGLQPSKPGPTEQRGPEPVGGSDESWRPSGRMRGSLTGRALPDDISQLLIQPSRGPGGPPPGNLTAPPHLQKSGPTGNQLPSASSSGNGNSQNPQ